MQRRIATRVLAAAIILLPALAAVAQATRPTRPDAETLSPEDQELAEWQARMQKRFAGLLADARRLQKEGRTLDAYGRAVEAVRLDRESWDARELAVACRPGAVRDWEAAWTKFLGGRPLEASVGQVLPWPPADADPADRAVWEALRKTVPQVAFSGSRLEEVIQFIRDAAKANVHVRWRGMAEAKISKDTPVELELKNVSLETALRFALNAVSTGLGQDNRLCFDVRGGVLRIGTNQDLARDAYLATYDIRGLLDPCGPKDLPDIPSDFADLDPEPVPAQITAMLRAAEILALLRRTVDPESWIEGSPTSGVAKCVDGVLTVRQTAGNHRRIRGILALLRWSRSPAAAAAKMLHEAAIPVEAKAGRALREKLETVVPKFDFHNRQLKDAVAYVRELTGGCVYVNWPAAAEEGIAKDAPVDVQLRQVTLRSAMEVLLDEASGDAGGEDRLAMSVRHGVLVISPAWELDCETTIRAYDCRDLLAHAVARAALLTEVQDYPPRPVRMTVDDLFEGDDEALADDDDDDLFGECKTAATADPWREPTRQLIDLLKKTIDDESWIEGSPTSGTAVAVGGVLFVRQMPQNHEQIARLLASYRKHLLGAPAAEGKPQPPRTAP